MRALRAFTHLAIAVGLVFAQEIDPDTEDLNSLGNNTLFLKWRPRFHFISPAGWMNDPCAAMYDNGTDTYHLHYQFHPNHVNWGNISWGHATSKDMVTWEDVGGWEDGQAQSLVTGGEDSYDHLGVFSGTGQVVNLQGEYDGTQTLFYTSVKRLPTGWRIPYQEGTETQSLATSTDGGKTWTKYEGNPVIIEPPTDWNITGWRDPFYHDWPEMDNVLGNDEPHYYCIFGSGIKEVGPRLPFYSAPASNLTDWTYLGGLFEVERNASWGNDSTITGSYGYNFEVAGFFSLVEEEKYGGDNESVHYFVNMGTEGGNTTLHPNNHWSLWSMGIVTKRENGSAEFDFAASGVGDWGNLYAVTSFWDKKNNRRVAWGWSEEDLNGYGLLANGYQGSMGLPREWFVLVTSDVQAPEDGVTKNDGIWTQDSDTGMFTVKTLGTHPLPDVVEGLRNGSATNMDNMTLSDVQSFENFDSDHFELSFSMSDVTEEATCGFHVRRSPEGEEYTSIAWSPTDNMVMVNRDNSSLYQNFTKTTYGGHFAPYNLSSGLEPVNFHVFVDGSLLEIFINNRFALTTRVYPTREDATGVAFFCENGNASISNVAAYQNMNNAWPERPELSNSTLVFDTSEETNNYTWWAGF